MFQQKSQAGAGLSAGAPQALLAKAYDEPVVWLTDQQSVHLFGRFCDPNGEVLTQVVKTVDPGSVPPAPAPAR
jgi:hypothetical protein